MKRIEPALRRTAIVAIALSLLTASAARAQKATEKLAEDRKGFRESVTAIRGQIDSTLSSLSAIVEGKDAGARKSALKKYGSEIKAMEKEIDKTNAYADKMRESGKDFFKNWEKSMKGVTNETLKASANERRTTFQAQYDEVEAGIAKAKEVGADFWKNLQDLQKYFANDMSDSAIATASPLISTTNEDGKKIAGFIDEVIAAVDEIGAQPKPEAAKAAEEPAPPEVPAKPEEPATPKEK